MEVFPDRAAAGRRLAEELSRYRGRDVLVLGLPRGGVPVAAEVARSLGAPLDVLVVRKLGVPTNRNWPSVRLVRRPTGTTWCGYTTRPCWTGSG